MHTKYTWNIYILAALMALLCFGALPPSRGLANTNDPLPQASSAMDLVNAVNAYRAQFGLQPYSVDGGLMALAQDQSAYQASIGTCTHARADGSGPAAQGISAENIACGQNLSASDAIQWQWTDQVHQATMVGPDSGQVGAGAVEANGMVYYTLDVRRGTGEFIARAQVNSAPAAQEVTATSAPPNVAVPAGFATSTPNADGSIAHVLTYGETLVEIANAYGISLADLISINRLDPQKPVYFAGQVLIIRNAFTPTPFITTTFTPRPPTRTPLPTRTPRPTRTPSSPQTPLPTLTATAPPLVRVPTLDDLGPNRNVMAYGFIAVSAIGLVVLVITAFLPGKKG